MYLNRRQLLSMGGVFALGYGAVRWWPDDGIFNPCLIEGLPPSLRQHELVQAAWEGIDSAQYWDGHAHLVGVGDGHFKTWVSPNLRSMWHPFQRTQFAFYLNAACVKEELHIDDQFIARLRRLMDEFPAGAKAMLLAFDYYHDDAGQVRLERSTFHTPNSYAAHLAKQVPDRFEWIASIHPYRPDAIEALTAVIAQGARAVKWLPPAMGIDPSSSRCDSFYETLARHNMPLLSHAGHEHAVDAADLQRLGNPLLLRRALDHGVRVIVAHCASLGSNVDLDVGAHGPEVPNIDLFARMMGEARYEGRLFGDVSAIIQVNRDDEVLRRIVLERDWHPRLIHGSDYPLPAVMPVISASKFVSRGYLAATDADVLSQIRQYNALLFDFILKRRLRIDGVSLPASVFQTRGFFKQ